MKTKKILKNQKPIDFDAHFKYRCPEKNCGYDHWISLNESKTKNFKVVCDCGTVFMPKTISKVKLVYKTKNKIQPKSTNPPEDSHTNFETKVPVDIMDSCVTLLVGYGFTKEESSNLITNAYKNCESKEPASLIKFVLHNLEQSNVT